MSEITDLFTQHAAQAAAGYAEQLERLRSTETESERIERERAEAEQALHESRIRTAVDVFDTVTEQQLEPALHRVSELEGRIEANIVQHLLPLVEQWFAAKSDAARISGDLNVIAIEAKAWGHPLWGNRQGGTVAPPSRNVAEQLLAVLARRAVNKHPLRLPHEKEQIFQARRVGFVSSSNDAVITGYLADRRAADAAAVVVRTEDNGLAKAYCIRAVPASPLSAQRLDRVHGYLERIGRPALNRGVRIYRELVAAPKSNGEHDSTALARAQAAEHDRFPLMPGGPKVDSTGILVRNIATREQAEAIAAELARLVA